MKDIPNIQDLPESLRDNPQYIRYLKIWSCNETSITFVPLAQMLRERGFLEEAREVCEMGLKYNVTSISGRLILAAIYSALGRMGDAKDLAVQVLKRMPGHPEALKYISEESSIKDVKSTKPAKTVLKRIPGHPGALKNTSKKPNIKDVKSKDRALSVLDSRDEARLGALDIKDLWLTPTMAEILAGQGELREAINILNRLRKKEPKNVKIRKRIKELQEIGSGDEKTLV